MGGGIDAPADVWTSLQHVVRRVPAISLSSLEDELHPSREPGRLISWLSYLKCSGSDQFPEDWETLWRLFDHDDATVRYLAFDLALRSRDARLAQRHYESNWAAAKSQGFLESWAGSSLLCEAATQENFVAISERIDPQWSAVLWNRFDHDPAYSGPFEAFFASSVERELNPPSSRQIPEYRCAPQDAMRILLGQKVGPVTALAERLFETRYVSVFIRDEWPRLELLQALFALDPARAAGIWRRLTAQRGPFRGTSGTLDALPFEAPDGEEVEALRTEILENARDDWALAGIGMFIAEHQRAGWAVHRIKQLLTAPTCPGDIARAITLAGLLDDSDVVRELWSRELSAAPLDGWLGVVHRDARQNIERAWRALDWLEEAFIAETDEQFFACWHLFVRSADRRTRPIAFRRINERLPSLSSRRSDYVALNWRAVGERIDKEKNDRSATLFSFRIGHRWALPWGNA